MNYFLKLIDFIKINQSNWKELLSEAPFHLIIKQCPFLNDDQSLKYPELYMLSYNQLESDFHNDIVKACRGSIVSIEDINNPKMVCVPFYKFANYGESYADVIDWDSATVLDKVDGSLLKFFKYKGESIWVTNNGWNIGSEIPMTVASPFEEHSTDNMNTFEQLKDFALSKIDDSEKVLDNLDADYTYMFELISPKNRIICTYPETKLVLLGIRNKNNYQEVEVEEKAHEFGLDIFEVCKVFNLSTIESVLRLCDSYKDALHEGVIIRDKFFKRVKIKCKHYLALKGLKGEIGFTDKKIFEAIKEGAIDDAVSAFPEIEKDIIRIKDTYLKYKNAIYALCKEARKRYDEISDVNGYAAKKKAYASWVFSTNPKLSHFLFETIKETPRLDYEIDKISYKDIEEYVKQCVNF